ELTAEAAFISCQGRFVPVEMSRAILFVDQRGRHLDGRAQFRKPFQVRFDADDLAAPPTLFEVRFDQLAQGDAAERVFRRRQKSGQVYSVLGSLPSSLETACQILEPIPVPCREASKILRSVHAPLLPTERSRQRLTGIDEEYKPPRAIAFTIVHA